MRKQFCCLLAAFSLSSVAYADFYQGSDDFDPSFQDHDYSREFPSDPPAAQNNYYYDEEAQPVPHKKRKSVASNSESYDYDLPHKIQTTEKVIIVDPNVHAWGAYSADGNLIRAGRATAGANWCPDIGRGCKTKSGVFHVYSLGSSDCISSKYPISEGGGAPMPYCMYFNGSQGLHGSNEVVEGNISHGCVRLRVSDAAWLRYNFVGIGTKVIVKPY